MGLLPVLDPVSCPSFVVVPEGPERPGRPAKAVRIARTPPRPLVPAPASLAAIRALPLFAGVPESELQGLAAASRLKRFDSGAPLMDGSLGDELVILVHGRAKTTMPRGIAFGEFVLGIFEQGDIVSEGCWTTGEGRGATAERRHPGETVALEDSAALFVPRRPLARFLDGHVRVTVRLLEAVSGRLQRILEMAMQNSCLEVGDRLYRRLVEIARTRGRSTSMGIVIEHGLLQRELAASIGASREVVNRQLAKWKAEGLVESGRRSVVVRNPRGLALSVSTLVRGDGFELPFADGRAVSTAQAAS